MGHLARLCQTVDERLAAGFKLILIARDLFRHMNILHKLAVVSVDGDLLRVVDIVYNQVTVGACNDTDIIAHAGCTRLKVAQHAV